jgi:hypothetical protein
MRWRAYFGSAQEEGLTRDEFRRIRKQVAHQPDDFEFMGEAVHQGRDIFTLF